MRKELSCPYCKARHFNREVVVKVRMAVNKNFVALSDGEEEIVGDIIFTCPKCKRIVARETKNYLNI